MLSLKLESNSSAVRVLTDSIIESSVSVVSVNAADFHECSGRTAPTNDYSRFGGKFTRC